MTGEQFSSLGWKKSYRLPQFEMDEKLKIKISVGHNNQNIFSNLGFRCDRKQEAIYGVEKNVYFFTLFFSTEDVYDWNGHFILNLGIAHSCQFWGLVSFFHNLFFSILFERTKVANKARKVFWKRRKRVFISNPSFSRKHSFLFWTNAKKRNSAQTCFFLWLQSVNGKMSEWANCFSEEKSSAMIEKERNSGGLDSETKTRFQIGWFVRGVTCTLSGVEPAFCRRAGACCPSSRADSRRWTAPSCRWPGPLRRARWRRPLRRWCRCWVRGPPGWGFCLLRCGSAPCARAAGAVKQIIIKGIVKQCCSLNNLQKFS